MANWLPLAGIGYSMATHTITSKATVVSGYGDIKSLYIRVLLSGHVIIILFNKYRHYSHKYVSLI
jgi:hypothetical protein